MLTITLQKLFPMAEGMPFWTGFNELAEKLHEATRDLSQADYVNLYEPPESIRDSLLMATDLTAEKCKGEED